MLSVSLVRCKNEALKKLYFKSIIKCFKRVKIDKWPDSPCTHFPHRLLHVKNKCAASSFIQWWYSVIDFLIVTASISKLLHSWLFIDLSEHHYTALTSKFNNFFNRSSTMLNNVFNVQQCSEDVKMHKNNAEDNVASHSHTKPPRKSHIRKFSWNRVGRGHVLAVTGSTWQLWEISGCYRVYVATCK